MYQDLEVGRAKAEIPFEIDVEIKDIKSVEKVFMNY